AEGMPREATAKSKSRHAPIDSIKCRRGRVFLAPAEPMSFEPEAIRAFEHAGWQRAASAYGNSFAQATAPYTAPLLEAAEISPGQHVLDVACGPAVLAPSAGARRDTAHRPRFFTERGPTAPN